MTPTWETTTTRHGTTAGWSLHRDLGERPCDACYAAKQEYDKRYKAAPERAKANRKRASAQNRAFIRLSHLYPDIYRALYEQELTARGVSIPRRGAS